MNLYFEEHQDTECSTNAKTGDHFSPVSFYVKHHRKYDYIHLKSKEITLRQWNANVMWSEAKKEELLTTFWLTDNPVARRMGCSPTYGQPTYTNTLKQGTPAAFWHSVIVFLRQHSSTDCIQTQVRQPQQQRGSSKRWPFWATRTTTGNPVTVKMHWPSQQPPALLLPTESSLAGRGFDSRSPSTNLAGGFGGCSWNRV